MHHPTSIIALQDASTGAVTATLSVDLSAGDAPEWVHLIPAGTTKGVDGRGPYKLSDPKAVITASLTGRPLPIDYDHAIDRAADDGRPAPAAGWIEELEVRDDGIWGRVAWTARGAEALKSREYRYLSPVFLHDKSGTVMQLLRAALTNNPNLRALKALASQQGGPSTMDMEEFLIKLRAALGLDDTADANAVLAALGKTTDDVAAAAATASALPTIAKAAGLAETAKADEIVAAINAAGQKKGDQGDPDPAKFVPVEQVTALQSRLTDLEKSVAGDKATQAVDGAIKDGKLMPSLRDWGLALHAKDPQAFATLIEKSPKILGDGAVVTGQVTAGANGLTADESAIIARQGVDPEAFKKIKAQMES